MKNLNRIVQIFVIIAIISACSQSSQNSGEQDSASEPEATAKLTLTKAPASPEFAEAQLIADVYDMTPTDTSINASFEFVVENYDLGVQTPDAAERGIANSGNGQHIHLIINNGPYSAHYEPAFEKQLDKGENVVLAFLSRSYHESVKNPNAFFLEVFTEDDAMPEFDLEGQHMFYSRPKGTYSGADTEKLMIDFYLINTSISPDGNKVRATVNGQEFMIDEWAPYYVEGLPKGTATVKLELLDSNGNLIPGPFNSVTREVTLE